MERPLIGVVIPGMLCLLPGAIQLKAPLSKVLWLVPLRARRRDLRTACRLHACWLTCSQP